MTKEEVINKAIELEFGSGNAKSIRAHNSSLVKVAEYLYDLMQPSLPSNLDEAAEEYENNLGYYECINQWPSVAFKAGAEWMAEQGWHDVTETPSIFGFYLVIHEKGWCVANYMGEGTVCESGWVEAIHHIEIERPQKWLDLRDLIPKKQ